MHAEDTSIFTIFAIAFCLIHARDLRRWVHRMQSGMYLIYWCGHVHKCTGKIISMHSKLCNLVTCIQILRCYISIPCHLPSSIHCNLPAQSDSPPRLQSMAIFAEISGAEKAQILGAGAQNRCQAQILIELRGKSNKICVKNIKIRPLGANSSVQSGKRESPGALIFFL